MTTTATTTIDCVSISSGFLSPPALSLFLSTSLTFSLSPSVSLSRPPSLYPTHLAWDDGDVCTCRAIGAILGATLEITRRGVKKLLKLTGGFFEVVFFLLPSFSLSDGCSFSLWVFSWALCACLLSCREICIIKCFQVMFRTDAWGGKEVPSNPHGSVLWCRCSPLPVCLI